MTKVPECARICKNKHHEKLSMDKMHSINKICRELTVARRTVHHWIATKQLRSFHIGKRLTRVWERDLVAFVEGKTKFRKG